MVGHMNDLRTGTRSWIGSVGRVVRQPVLRRVLPGMLVSALGDGMSMVAVAWLAVQIAPPDQAGVWTGLAVAAAGLLNPVAYVALFSVSSLLHAWGNAGAYTLVAELLPDEERVTGNALLSTFTQVAMVVGPALAGGLTALVGPGWVIGASTPPASAYWRPVAGRPRVAEPARSRSPPGSRRLAGVPSSASPGCSD
jgi:hypothetical protein